MARTTRTEATTEVVDKPKPQRITLRDILETLPHLLQVVVEGIAGHLTDMEKRRIRRDLVVDRRFDVIETMFSERLESLQADRRSDARETLELLMKIGMRLEDGVPVRRTGAPTLWNWIVAGLATIGAGTLLVWAAWAIQTLASTPFSNPF